ncbi:MAG: HAD family hydrolase [Clostridia bacterium]|nr:HAD family hydrolase [Clostridia bacterium]
MRRKPHPDMLRSAAERLGVELGRCLYVGDSEVDIDTANNAGIDCLCVSWGFRTRAQLRQAGARHIIDDPMEMVDFVEGKAGKE